MEVPISQDFPINTYFPITTYPIKFFEHTKNVFVSKTPQALVRCVTKITA